MQCIAGGIYSHYHGFKLDIRENAQLNACVRSFHNMDALHYCNDGD